MFKFVDPLSYVHAEPVFLLNQTFPFRGTSDQQLCLSNICLHALVILSDHELIHLQWWRTPIPLFHEWRGAAVAMLPYYVRKREGKERERKNPSPYPFTFH